MTNFKRSLTLFLISTLAISVWGETVSLTYEGTGSFPRNSSWSSDGEEAEVNHTTSGSYCASFSVNGSAYITYNTSLTNVSSISLWGERTSNNTTHPTIAVEGSTNGGSSWSTLVDASVFTLSKNSWSEKVIDISPAFTGLVRLKYTNTTTAVKYIDDITITYSASGGSKGATPAFSPVAGTYCGSQTVTISSTTTGSTIYYTTDGSTPSTGSAHGTAGAANASVTVGSNQTVKAIAVKDGMTNSDAGSAAYTITAPLTTMDAIYSAAASAGNTATSACIEFDNWVVSGVSTNGKNVYVTDGTKGFMIFNNSAGMGFSVGNILSGAVSCKVQLYNGTAELTELSSTTDGLSVTTGGTVIPTVMTTSDISSLTGVNTGRVITTTGECTYSSTKYYINGAQLYNQLYAYTTPTPGTTYTVTGVYLQYNSTQEILPLGDLSTGPLTSCTISFNAGTGTCETSSLTEASAGSGVTLPTATHACEGWSLAGWSTSSCTETTIAPTLYTAGSNYKPAADITLYAVYKKSVTTGDTPKEYTLTLTGTDAPSSYSGTMSNKDAVASDLSTFTVSFGTTDVMRNSSNIQFKASSGDLYNTTDLGEINSVTISQEGTKLAYAVGTSQDPWDLDEGGYFSIYNTSGNAAYASQIVVVFTTTNSTTTTTYNSNPICGPIITANNVECLTSTKDQTVKSQAITVKGSNLSPASGTLEANITGADAGFFNCTLASSSIAGGSINTTYVISYTPDDFGGANTQHTATLTFSDGVTTSNEITLLGRSLPEQFAIIAYDGTNYYALDGAMSGTAKQATPLPVEVSGGNTVVACPTRAIYSLTERETPDANAYLVGSAGRLWGSSSSADLNTKSTTSTSQTGWLLSTSDFSTYHITNADVTDRGLMLNTTSNYIGHYKTTQYGKSNYYGDLYIMPFTSTCTCLNPPTGISVIAKATTATITWEAVAGATNYEVTCPGGSVVVDVPNLKATITGLTSNTNYTYSIKAVASVTDCSLTQSNLFRTANCDDVPYSIHITPALQSATIRWQMESAKATIKIYSDEACTSLVGTSHTDLTSPATISGLTENTKYYAKIFSGSEQNCESAAVEFTTNSPSVELAEWFPDSIRIVIDAGTDASVIIEDKKEHGSVTANYADDIFFSKYFEAAGLIKLLGIYNGTDHDVDISDLIIRGCASNSNSWPTSKSSNNYVVLADITELQNDYGTGSGEIMLPQGTEIILYSMGGTDEDQQKYVGDGNCITQFIEWTALKNNTIDNWYRIGKSNGGKDDDNHNVLNFSGPNSIILERNNTTIIDIIGAGTSSGAVRGTTKVTTSKTLGNGEIISTPNDAAGFWCDAGMSPAAPGYPDGYSTYLSTNRCLLVRKHVVSGANAVASNTSTFSTLCTEWIGVPIGYHASDNAADKCRSGQQFGYVGTFDYNNYFATYDSIAGLDELTGKQNADGTYTVPIPDLDTLSCTMMKVKVYEGGVEKASREYKVPIMVDKTKAWTTNDTIFKNKWHDLDACEECDVVILKGATLTKTNEGANDASTVRNLTIYPGGTMVVPNSRTFNVSSIQFRVEGEQTPIAKLNGTLNTNDQLVLVSRRIKNDRYYFFSLPYDCNISDVRWSNGEPAVNNVDYRIAEYDSEKRALEGSTKGTPGHYKIFSGSTLKAGVGYVIATNDRYFKELIFPMEIGGTNLTEAEDNKTSNKVTLHQYTGPSSINNHNWNFIAHPYVSPFNAYNDGKIKAGWLNCVSPQTDTEDAVWEYVDDAHVYLTMPSFGAAKTTFTQTLASTVATINPFLGVFVQAVVDNEDLTFEQSNRVLSAPARFMASKAENEDESIFVGVTLSGNGQSDQTNLRIRPDFTDEYQLGYDLLKFTTYYTERPQIFMKAPAHQLAFQAVNDSVAKNTFLPMGVYCEYAGTYTFALTEDYPIDEVEAVYLYDKTTGTTTNLLYDTYSITTSGRLNTTTRFSLNVRLNRKAPQITTGIETLDAPDNMVRKILINGHVYIQRGEAIYDITGKEVFNF